MASRWRIRHKLLLGVALVVGIMALLLGGAARGLWSYYLTTNSIRAKLDELVKAEDFKSAVADLVHETEKQILNPSPLLGLVKGTREMLHVYEERLKDNLDHGHDPGMGFYETGQVQRLHEDLDEFHQAIEKLIGSPRADAKGDAGRKEEDLETLKSPITKMQRDTKDLHEHIKEELGRRIKESRRHYQVAFLIIVPTSVIGLLVMIGLMRSFYTWVFSPIRHLEESVAKLARGEFSHRIDLDSGDEMQDLAVAFNDMTQKLQDLYGDLARQVNERSRQLVRSERLASVGFLAAGVAHEINNPLASIAFCSEALEARLGDLLRHLRATGRGVEEHEIFSKYLRMIQEEAFRCKNITERLLAFSRAGERKREDVNLRELVQSVVDLAHTLQHHKGKDIYLELPERDGRTTAWGNGEEIKSVVLNLVINALDSMEEGGKLSVRLGQREGMAEMVFTDTGCGMTQEVLENIFEPFFTRSRSGKGTGLGLTISHRIINQHGGEIEAFSLGLGQGSTFIVRLPVQPAESAYPGTETAPRLAA